MLRPGAGRCGAYLKENQAVVVRGRLSVRDEKAPQVLADSVYPLSTVKGGLPPEKPKGRRRWRARPCI